MVTPDAKRKAVAHACTVHAVSQRRACLALTIDPSTVRYTSIRKALERYLEFMGPEGWATHVNQMEWLKERKEATRRREFRA